MEQQIMARTLRFVQQAQSTAAEFNEQALALFTYQFTYNLPYQCYCRTQGKTPAHVNTWQEIPAMPLHAFKEHTVSCSDAGQAKAVFLSSGLTNGQRGKHYLSDLAVYDLSAAQHFKTRFMDAEQRLTMGMLFPTPEQLPISSLAHYLSVIVKQFGSADSGYFMDAQGLQLDKLILQLESQVANNQAYALLGPSFSFVHLFEGLAARNRRFVLPKGSKLLDTGGYKQKSEELDTETFYRKMQHYLGVERSHCINMFGMTVLSSQLYNQGSQVLPAPILGPHWLKTRVVHPITGAELPNGEPGLLVHTDLANYNAVASVLTADRGINTAQGFIWLGKAES